LELIEEFISEATWLPSIGHKWFKNSKIEEVPWSLFMTSRKINWCEKGIPFSLLKVRWHGLLSVLKQFMTCEGCYGLVFLYHIRLLMHFIVFHLNVPFYFLRILYKMSKMYKRQILNSSLFHHGLIKILLVHHLTTLGDEWDGFLTRNGFAIVIPIETPILGEPLIRKQFNFSSNEPEYLKKNPHDEAIPSQFLHGKHDVGSDLNETPMHELIFGHNTTVKSNSKNPHK
jgi:hypothetical protein